MPQPHVHPFYRIWFTWIDPIVLALSVSTAFLDPATALDMLVPASKLPYVPEQAAVIHQIGLLYAFMGILFAVLLRISSDRNVWRVLQAATLFVDVFLIVLSFVSLEQQERLKFEKWRGIDGFNLLFTVWVAVLRIAFLAEVGGDGTKLARKSI